MENGYDEVSHADCLIKYKYEHQAKEMIFKRKVEMCFEHLFPNIKFDDKELENQLFLRI